MAKFAFHIMKNMHELTRSLQSSLGVDTGDLTLRIGLHSGPTTAGKFETQSQMWKKLLYCSVDVLTNRVNMISLSYTPKACFEEKEHVFNVSITVRVQGNRVALDFDIPVFFSW